MRYKSGLKFGPLQNNSEFRIFVNEQWEYHLKRNFAGNEPQDSFALRPPAKVFSTRKRIMGSIDNYALSK